jgi:hypothetical protein
MNLSNTLKLIAASTIFTWATSTFAHESYGLSVSHWHGGEALGFVVVASLVAFMCWLASRK